MGQALAKRSYFAKFRRLNNAAGGKSLWGWLNGVQMDEQNFTVREDERLIDEASNHCLLLLLLLLACWLFFLVILYTF